MWHEIPHLVGWWHVYKVHEMMPCGSCPSQTFLRFSVAGGWGVISLLRRGFEGWLDLAQLAIRAKEGASIRRRHVGLLRESSPSLGETHFRFWRLRMLRELRGICWENWGWEDAWEEGLSPRWVMGEGSMTWTEGGEAVEISSGPWN